MSAGRPMAGLVLCGGASRRMGTDKAMVHVEGQPLVERVAARIATVADPIVLATGEADRLPGVPYVQLADPIPNAGPMAGLVAGIEASPHELVAAVAVDLPFASAAVLALLRDLWDGEATVVPVADGRPQPLHAVYSRRALEPLRAALLERRLALREVLVGERTRLVPEQEWRVADPSGRFAANINSPRDLAAAFDARPEGES